MDSWVLRDEATQYLGDVVILRADGQFELPWLDSTFWLALFVVKENPEAPAAMPTSVIIDRVIFMLLLEITESNWNSYLLANWWKERRRTEELWHV